MLTYELPEPIDEMKTDGNFIYSISEDKLSIFAAFAHLNPYLLSKVDLGFRVKSFSFGDNRVLILGTPLDSP